MKVAFIGLGVMGFPMAGYLVAKGHTVTVYNRTPARAAAWIAKYGNVSAPTPREACKGAEIAFLEKPYTALVLARRVREALDAKKPSHEALDGTKPSHEHAPNGSTRFS